MTLIAYPRVKELRLLSTMAGQSQYESLSFAHISDRETAVLLRSAISPSSKPGLAQLATGALGDAAKQLEASQLCSSRAPGSVMAMYPDALCVAIESDGGDAIDAAPWVHLTHEDKRSGVHRIWIAPVIARSTNLVRELVLGTIAIWEEQTPSYTSTVATCVVFKRSGDGQSGELFSSLGFHTVEPAPIMRKGLGDKPLPSVPPLPSALFAFPDGMVR